MTERRRWVRRSDDKIPLTGAGRYASSTKSNTWASFDHCSKSTAGVGLGYVLGDGVGVIDLDHAIVGGVVLPWAAKVLEANPDTFTEVSMSGEGLHIWGLLPEGPGRVIRDDERCIEVYSTGRYVAMGSTLPGTSMELKPLKI